MNQNDRNHQENNASPSEENLHTEDVRQHIEQMVQRQKDSLSAIQSGFDLKTDKNLDALQELVEGQRYKLITQNVGTVKQVGDGVAIVSGLKGVMENELVVFPDGTYGLAMDLHEFYVGCVILGAGDNIQAGDVVYETGRVVDVPVGKDLLGRVVNALGQPIDGLGPLDTEDHRPIEFPATGFIFRSPIDTPLQTGIKAIDSIIPLGKGQRELIIGDRQTGKSAIAVDTVINQKGQDVYCIYVCLGQKMSSVAQIVDTFKEHGAMEYTTVIAASAEDSPSLIYLAPYAGCAMAEEFMYSGGDALIIYDDLSKHAIAYRQLSLLLERPAGREAYPGDIFYLHSRLLERSANLSMRKGGGSMTALPIVETQAGNISAYIPTNLISITDGQIYLSTKLFDEGLLPAIDIGLSVSRVGGAAQNDAMRAVSKNLALDVAQYLELRVFARFGTELDMETRQQLDRGEKIRTVLTQPQYEPLPVAHQVAIIYAATEGYLDEVPIEKISDFEKLFIKNLKQYHGGLLTEFAAGRWNPELEKELHEILTGFINHLYEIGFLEEQEEIEILMHSINEIQNHLQGMEDIKHLLRSVRAMSAIRWRRAKQHLEIAQHYAEHVESQLGTIFAVTGPSLPEKIAHLEVQQGRQRNVGLIALTSDRGLCGNFNTGLVSKAIQVTDILQRKNKPVKIISFGGYGERLFMNAGYEIFFTERIPSSQAVSFVNIRKAISHIRSFYEAKDIHELNILYNQFNYFGSYTPKSVQILPPQFDEIHSATKSLPEDLIVNSDPQELKTFLVWEYLAARLYLSFIESTISEHSARLQTMDTAISNLDQRVADLEIQYHTIRQEKITQDVLEVQSNLRDRKKNQR